MKTIVVVFVLTRFFVCLFVVVAVVVEDCIGTGSK